jgi:hypothetical protein
LLLKSKRDFKKFLRSKGVHFVDVESLGYADVWSYWRKSLADLAPRLLQQFKRKLARKQLARVFAMWLIGANSGFLERIQPPQPQLFRLQR